LVLLVLILFVVMFFAFPQELESFINNILNLVGLEAELAVLSF
jgi:hypothetical protein